MCSVREKVKVLTRLKKRWARRLVLSIAVCTFVVSSFVLWQISGPSNALRVNLKDLIRKELICVDPLPSATMVDAIYVLGGSQTSLKFKFITATSLYHKGICKRILILSRPGKTEYSSLPGRNLTNDEWAILTLEELGIPEKRIEAISIKEGFFGTFTEAKGVSKLIKKRGYKRVLLISSPYHTHRVRISFENFLKDQTITFYVQSSDKRVFLRHLMIEFIKLKVYQYLLVSSKQCKVNR